MERKGEEMKEGEKINKLKNGNLVRDRKHMEKE